MVCCCSRFPIYHIAAYIFCCCLVAEDCIKTEFNGMKSAVVCLHPVLPNLIISNKNAGYFLFKCVDFSGFSYVAIPAFFFVSDL